MLDPRWAGLVARHPRASAFHTVAWLEALHRTYGFEPVAYTTSPPGCALEDGIVFCRVASPIGGRRLVSLPFSDHCEPLLEDPADEGLFLTALAGALRKENWRHVEIRAAQAFKAPARLRRSVTSYCFHRIDLAPDLDTLFGNCHRSCIQRKILRAQREPLVCDIGRVNSHFDAFWNLFLMTRRRHAVPPPPKRWFRNLIDGFGEALQIRVAWKGRQPVAAILTLRHKQTLVYKYGGSDPRFHNLGGMPFLFWKSIQDAKRDGLTALDLGRTDLDNAGLITFKDRFGAARSTLTYSRFGTGDNDPSSAGHSGWTSRAARAVLARLPDPVFSAVGGVLYRHFG